MPSITFNTKEGIAWIKEILATSEAEVTFTKKNGTVRIMNCTLMKSLLPFVDPTKTFSTRKRSEEVLRVFDLDIQEWRSFRFDSVVKIDLSTYTWRKNLF